MLRVLGVHAAEGVPVVVVDGSGAVCLAWPGPGHARVGPLHTPEGPAWLAPSWEGATLWEVVVAHPDGVGEAAALWALREVVAAGSRAIDPDASYVDEAGRLRCARGPGPLSALARYLLRGELAHAPSDDEPPWVASLDEDPSVGLALREGDGEAWRGAVRRASRSLVEAGPHAGEVWAVTAPAAPRSGSTEVVAPPRARLARSAGLTLLLGLAAGWVLGRGAGATVEIVVHEVAGLTVACADTRHESTAPRLTLPVRPLLCRVEVRAGDVVAATALDMARGGRYECRVVGEEVACDGP